MQGSDVKILSTRLMDDTCIHEAAGHGVRITYLPFISITPVNNALLDNRLAILATQHILAVFTSVNAVTAVCEKTGRKPDWEIACINGQTADAAGLFFGQEQVKMKGADSRELAEIIVARNPGIPVIFFCGNLRMNYLPARLSAAGIDVQEIIVYHTDITPVETEETYDGIVFFSPSAVDSFFRLNRIDTHTVLFAIGSTTANHIKKYTDNPVLCSKYPSQLSITESIINYYDQK